MIWLAWRQFRAQALVAFAVLTAVTGYLLVIGLHMHHAYAIDVASCTPQNTCDGVLNRFSRDYEPTFHLLELLVVVVPAIIGMFWGAPLVGREMENGTHQLVWNQSVTRTRWLAIKLAVVGLASVATAAGFTYLLTWWAGPLDHIFGHRFEAMTFASRDIVPLGYSAFFFALGTTLGLIVRRTVPAMALTFAVFVALQILVPALVRPHLLPSTTVTFAIDESLPSRLHGFEMSGGGAEMRIAVPIPDGAWITSSPPMMDASGHAVSAHDHPDCFPALPSIPDAGPGPGALKSGPPGPDEIVSCLAPFGLHQTVVYQPASHYWPLQWIETTSYAILAALLITLCFVHIRRRRN